MSCHAARELDLLGYNDTAVHRLDSRVKLIVALALIVCVASFPKYEIAGLVPFFAAPVTLGILGRVPARPILRLLVAAAPFAVLVGLFNPLLDRVSVPLWGSVTIAAGWLSFFSIVLRFMLTVSMALVLVSTTSLPGLLHGLLQMRAPRPFVTQIQFLYRYLFLLIEEGQTMSRARRLRDPRRLHAGLGVLKQMLSSLLWKTWDRADRVYRSMKARGFQGDVPSLRRDRFHASDFIFLGTGLSVCLAMRLLPLTQWVGEWIIGSLS
jgi:cobalt/nickel transport system permease protein